MNTINEVRKAFWAAHPFYASEYRVFLRQNDYKTDIRVAFCDFVDYLQKSNQIDEKLARKVTL